MDAVDDPRPEGAGGKVNDRLRECILIFAPCRSVTLRAAWLVHQVARKASK